MGHVTVGIRWDRVSMDLLDFSVTSAKGKSVCFSDGGLFLQMDGGLSVARQDRLVDGGCCLPICCLPLRNA